MSQAFSLEPLTQRELRELGALPQEEIFTLDPPVSRAREEIPHEFDMNKQHPTVYDPDKREQPYNLSDSQFIF